MGEAPQSVGFPGRSPSKRGRWATHGCSKSAYYACIDRVLAIRPHVVVDDGCDLTVKLHEKPELVAEVLGACEQTTSGVLRARNMAAEGALKFPLLATNDNKTKHLLDNYYGTGQSVWDGILRATALFAAGKTAVVCGYGACGKGIALRAKGLGAKVVVTEVAPRANIRGFFLESLKFGGFAQ